MSHVARSNSRGHSYRYRRHRAAGIKQRPAFTNVIADDGVAVAVGVGESAFGVGSRVGGAEASGSRSGLEYRRSCRRRRQGPGWNQQTACPLITGAPIGAPLAGYLELAL